MNTRRSIATLAAAVLCALLVSTSAPVYATDGGQGSDQNCLPGLSEAFSQRPVYGRLYSVLLFHRAHLLALLNQVDDQASYEALLTRAEAIAASIADGRLLMTLPDGTVVLDTARENDPTNALPTGNSYGHFVGKTVNENHNSRVAILSAQLYPCGVGLERKVSTTTSASESYVALRLGKHLNSAGTARLSTLR